MPGAQATRKALSAVASRCQPLPAAPGALPRARRPHAARERRPCVACAPLGRPRSQAARFRGRGRHAHPKKWHRPPASAPPAAMSASDAEVQALAARVAAVLAANPQARALLPALPFFACAALTRRRPAPGARRRAGEPEGAGRGDRGGCNHGRGRGARPLHCFARRGRGAAAHTPRGAQDVADACLRRTQSTMKRHDKRACAQRPSARVGAARGPMCAAAASRLCADARLVGGTLRSASGG